MSAENPLRTVLRLLILITGAGGVVTFLALIPQGISTRVVAYGAVAAFSVFVLFTIFTERSRKLSGRTRLELCIVGLTGVFWSGVMAILLFGRFSRDLKQCLEFAQIFIGGMFVSALMVLFISGDLSTMGGNAKGERE